MSTFNISGHPQLGPLSKLAGEITRPPAVEKTIKVERENGLITLARTVERPEDRRALFQRWNELVTSYVPATEVELLAKLAIERDVARATGQKAAAARLDRFLANAGVVDK